MEVTLFLDLKLAIAIIYWVQVRLAFLPATLIPSNDPEH